MAATKRRERKFPQAEFDMPLSDAVASLLDPQDVAPGDAWHFHVDGDVLRITRTRAPEETLSNVPPRDGGPSPLETGANQLPSAPARSPQSR